MSIARESESERAPNESPDSSWVSRSATGVVYGIQVLKALREAGIESHLVMSKAAELTCAYETDLSSQDIRDLADVTYPVE